MEEELHYVECPCCGRRLNKDLIYCDICKSTLSFIKLGDSWYTTLGLEKDNPFDEKSL